MPPSSALFSIAENRPSSTGKAGFSFWIVSAILSHVISVCDKVAQGDGAHAAIDRGRIRKANRHEREIVRTAEAKGMEAERAYASNG